MTNASKGRVGVALSPPDQWRKCWRCGVEYMGLSACPDCATENAPEEVAADGLAPWYRAIARWALDDSRQS